jgi:phosphotriesterase-related protein
MTVRGAVPIEDLGFCLPHEHVFIDLVRVHPTQLLAYDFQLLDHSLLEREVAQFGAAVRESPFAAAGGPTIVELTSGPRMGRDPRALQWLSETADIHVVMSCGWYREPWFEADLERRSAAQLADHLVEEIERGVDGTGIRPGIIGELGTDRDFVSPAEERVLRAGARAHQRTGLTITLHARASRVALSQIEILREEGVAPGRIIVGHADSVHDPDYHEELAHLGVWVEFDTVRGKVPYGVERSLRYVDEARRRKYLGQLLLSGDVCALSHLHAYGGSGYDYLPSKFEGLLAEAGLSRDELVMLFVENPRRALTGG